MTREERAMLIAFDERRPRKLRVIPGPVFQDVAEAPEELLDPNSDAEARRRFVMGGG
jgi:hypothetical protein